MDSFRGIDPTLEDYWRSIILFGRNVASYKFALARSLIELAEQGKTFVSLEELAVPFSRHLTDHLKIQDKQTTSQSSKFLDACRQFNQGELSQDELITQTTRLGFNNVIDAFHIVERQEIPQRFFTDERKGQTKGIALTDELFQLLQSEQVATLPQEVEARWRLVETAWGLNISRRLVTINYDTDSQTLFTQAKRRIDITSSRDALNGYQKGKCFYCFRAITIDSDSENRADVDHFFPHLLAKYGIIRSIDGVWNLVLACTSCNRGQNGKFDRLPALRYLERLNTRNEFLIHSHHPLRDTLMQQTGKTVSQRRSFLQSNYNEAQRLLGTPTALAWETPEWMTPPPF